MYELQKKPSSSLVLGHNCSSCIAFAIVLANVWCVFWLVKSTAIPEVQLDVWNTDYISQKTLEYYSAAF